MVRASDKVAPQGGGEFVIVISARGVEEVAKRVAEALPDQVRLPMKIGERELSISTSICIGIGFAIVPARLSATHREMLKEAVWPLRGERRRP